MKKITVKKGIILQRNGELNTKIYHVVSGLLRSYIIDAKGKEHIFMFAPENWIIGDSVSPTKPANLFIDALEDSVIEVFEKTHQIEHNQEKLINRITALQKRVIQLLSSSAIERYEDFVKTYPDITQRVPQKMIASYLGITPEALSTVKKARLQKN